MPTEGRTPAALILAGGLSSRMGQEKASLLIESKPLIKWTHDAAARFAKHIYVSVHDDETITRYKSLLPPQTTFIKDLYEGPRSALLAMLSGFMSIDEDVVAVVPVDSPFVSAKLMVGMASKATGFDLVVPMWPDGRIEAIHAVYARRSVAPILHDLWFRGILELREIPRHAKTLFIATEDLMESDPSLISLLDADTPSEFQTLKSTWEAIH